MIELSKVLFISILLTLTGPAAWADRVSGPVLIPAGKFAPLFGMDPEQKFFRIKEFSIDSTPVSQADYLKFLQQNPEWIPGKVDAVYADEKYLHDWKGSAPKPENLNRPVVYVSWFAADAYCGSKGGRLPTLIEWEYVAAASETKADASRDPEFSAKLLAWYSIPSGQKKVEEVGRSKPNFYGVSDMHELVWEWTSDFNSVFVNPDSRGDGDKMKSLFCGPGSVGASNREDYAAFMRYAMRSSLRANYTVGNLGFRCAK